LQEYYVSGKHANLLRENLTSPDLATIRARKRAIKNGRSSSIQAQEAKDSTAIKGKNKQAAGSARDSKQENVWREEGQGANGAGAAESRIDPWCSRFGNRLVVDS
jgi:hypothetical protein